MSTIDKRSIEKVLEFKKESNMSKVQWSIKNPVGAYLYNSETGKLVGVFGDGKQVIEKSGLKTTEMVAINEAGKHSNFGASRLGNKKVTSHEVTIDSIKYTWFSYK